MTAGSLRYIAQNMATGAFTDTDLPLSGVQLGFALSGPASLSAKLTPEFTSLAGVLAPWGTWLHVEDAGQIRASLIVLPGQLTDETMTVSAEGVSGYPHGITYLGDYTKYNVDPLDVVREIWSHVQSYPGGNIGVVLSDTHSPARTGAQLNFDGTVTPYAMGWWENKDCGREIDTLAKSIPFDYRENPAWNADRSAVTQLIQLGYPRLGRRRLDLRFAQDENITAVVPLEETADEFATDVLVVGAGQGRTSIRGFFSSPVAGRTRRQVTIVDQSITQQAMADQIAKDEVRRRQASLLAVRQITVSARHPNAPFGSFDCGDDILVQATVPWLGDIALWHRITSYVYEPETELATLQLQRSETFRYGRDDIYRPDTWYMDDPVLSLMDQTTIVS